MLFGCSSKEYESEEKRSQVLMPQIPVSVSLMIKGEGDCGIDLKKKKIVFFSSLSLFL